MVAFRKLIPVLALFALLIGVQSVSQAQTLQCAVTAGVPPVVRAEGFTELLGDIIITCTQGASQAPFLANFQVFLNTNVTSRLVGNGLSEAVLLIDDPGAGGRPTCLSPAPGSNGTGVAPGSTLTGTLCDGSATTGTNPQMGTYNAFLGERTSDIAGGSRENSLVWTNIPVVPPGTTGARTFRITNLRGNASGVGPGGLGLPGQIVAFLSISGVSSLALNNPQQIVGYVQPGMAFDLRNCANSGSSSIGVDQCVANTSGQRDLFDNPSADADVPALASFRFQEGFQSAFKSRIAVGQNGATPGTSFTGSESGFVLNAGTGFTTQGVGVADSGTRLSVRFSNVPANLRIFVSNRNGFSGSFGTDTTTGALINAPRAVLVSTDLNGAGGTSPTPLNGLPGIVPGGQYDPVGGTTFVGATQVAYAGPEITCSGIATLRAVEVPIVNGTGVAVWEVVDTGDPTLAGTLESLYFPYGLAYRYSTGSNQVGLGTGTVIGNLAPFYASAGTMSQILPIPRFVASTASPSNAVRIQACQTNLLFPYVTNWAGFDTGIAIANTSDDPFSDPQNRRQAGRCRMNYFGRLPNGNAPTTLREETDREVAAGETITMVLSTGGGLGLQGNANFQGYIIAQCDFRFAHGFAFITDGPIGQARVAEGYLALVLDGADAGRIRGQSTGEVRGH